MGWLRSWRSIVTGVHFGTGCCAGALPRFCCIILTYLTLPSIIGIAVCQHSTFAHGSAHARVYIEVLLPIVEVNCETAPLLAPAQVKGSQIAAMSGSTGYAQSCVVSQETTVWKHSPGVASTSAALTMLLTGGTVPSASTLVLPETIFLPEAFPSPPTPPSPRLDHTNILITLSEQISPGSGTERSYR